MSVYRFAPLWSARLWPAVLSAPLALVPVASALAASAAAPAAVSAPASAAASAAATLVPAQSEISFVSHQMGVPVSGSFRNFDAQVRFDPADLAHSKLVIGVEPASVALPTKDAMREVVKPEWFDAQRIPRAQFESTTIAADGRAHYRVSGRLTIKGHAQEVVVPVAIEQKGALSVATGSIVVHRLAFAIGDGEWTDTSVVADDVQVSFRLALTGIPAL